MTKNKPQKQIFYEWLLENKPKDNSWEIAFKQFKKAHAGKTFLDSQFKFFYLQVLKDSSRAVKYLKLKNAKEKQQIVKSKITLKDSKKVTETSNKKLLNSIDLPIYNTGVVKLPEDIFMPFKTGKAIDRLFSEEGGLMKGTVNVVTGDSGTGKSTVVYSMQSDLTRKYPDLQIACAQSEMSALDLEYEQTKKPWMTHANFLLLSKYNNSELYPAVLEKIFNHGYDILFLDSFQDIIGKLNAFAKMSEPQAERFLLQLISKTCNAENERKVYTTVVAVQQVTKGGIFKGSNGLKHAITGMLHLKFNDRKDRFAVFSKNRRNGKDVYKKMYFNLNEKNEMYYDEEAFDEAEKTLQILKNEKARLKEAEKSFDKIFQQTKLDVENLKSNALDDLVFADDFNAEEEDFEDIDDFE